MIGDENLLFSQPTFSPFFLSLLSQSIPQANNNCLKHLLLSRSVSFLLQLTSPIVGIRNMPPAVAPTKKRGNPTAGVCQPPRCARKNTDQIAKEGTKNAFQNLTDEEFARKKQRQDILAVRKMHVDEMKSIYEANGGEITGRLQKLRDRLRVFGESEEGVRSYVTSLKTMMDTEKGAPMDDDGHSPPIGEVHKIITEARNPLRICKARQVISVAAQEAVYMALSPYSHQGYSAELFHKIMNPSGSDAQRFKVATTMQRRAFFHRAQVEANAAADETFRRVAAKLVEEYMARLDADGEDRDSPDGNQSSA